MKVEVKLNNIHSQNKKTWSLIDHHERLKFSKADATEVYQRSGGPIRFAGPLILGEQSTRSSSKRSWKKTCHAVGQHRDPWSANKLLFAKFAFWLFLLTTLAASKQRVLHLPLDNKKLRSDCLSFYLNKVSMRCGAVFSFLKVMLKARETISKRLAQLFLLLLSKKSGGGNTHISSDRS